MVENKNEKQKMISIIEVLMLIMAEMVMILIKLVQPLTWTVMIESQPLSNFLNQFQYIVIEFILLVIIYCHLIYRRSFKELGITNVTKQVGMFILHLTFLGACMGVSYLMAKTNQLIVYDSTQIALTIILNFIGPAFIYEIIFRGYLLGTLQEVMGKSKKSLFFSVVIVSIVFTVVYMPTVIMEVIPLTVPIFIKMLLFFCCLSVYLCILYQLTQNLWLGISVHGTCLSLMILPGDFLIPIYIGVYLSFMIICLIFIWAKKRRVNKERVSEEKVSEEKVDLDQTLILPAITDELQEEMLKGIK